MMKRVGDCGSCGLMIKHLTAQESVDVLEGVSSLAKIKMEKGFLSRIIKIQQMEST